ncbi:MAG: poly-gamma-glutamate system protein [Deltaproteobacteria bacterium]|nr:poly-gamma-glutamate system protein [Deltaproteobacteria bacterium]
MKRLYWHLSKASWQVYALMAFLSILGLIMVETFKVEIKQPFYEKKLKAAQIMHNGLSLIKSHRMAALKEIAPLDKRTDPTESGMIGVLISPITSSPGDLQAKQTCINPNWAAVLVHMLKQAGVKEGDTIAMGVSGSFPAINLAALSAAEALNLKVLLISSLASSSWGANIPGLTWLDMENILYRERVIPSKSIAASLGGRSDRAKGMSQEGRGILQETILKNDISPLPAAKTRGENIDARMAYYQKHAEGKSIAAYINVGHGFISLGGESAEKFFKPGVNLTAKKRQAIDIDSVMSRFIQQGVPVIHMWPVSTIAQQYALPLTTRKLPTIGEGKIFKRIGYRNSLTAGVLVFLILALLALIRMDIGYRIFNHRQKVVKSPPEPMV